MSNAECVKVVVRCRPMNGSEMDRGCSKVVEIDKNLLQVRLKKTELAGSDDTDTESKAFTFDAVFDDDSLQSEVYDDTAYSLVKSVLDGYNGTIFACLFFQMISVRVLTSNADGQTGCGKTHTMQGKNEPAELRGIIPRTFAQIMDAIQTNPDPTKRFLVQVSFLEIYNEVPIGVYGIC